MIRKTSSDKTQRSSSALRGVVGNVTLTRSSVTAWFVQEPISTSFRALNDIEESMRSAASALAELTGKRIFWRVTARPYAVRAWAEETHRDAVQAGQPLPGWADFQRREQEHLLEVGLSEKWVYLGVQVASSRRHRDARREVAELHAELSEVSDRVAVYGLDARPARREDMDWLLRRSIGLGLPAPVTGSVDADYEESDIPELSESARWSCEPWGRTVKVTGKSPAGQDISRYVAVLTLGRMADQNIPEGPGWMQRTDRLGFAVEWMGTTDIVPSDKVTGRLRHQMDVIADQVKHYREDHHIEPPESLKRQHAMALQSEDEVVQGLGGMATRTEGWYRLAVWGSSEAEALANVRAVQKLYGRSVAWVHGFDQYRLASEFVPGQPLANTAHKRRMSVLTLAGALPAATAEIGDRLGAVIGWTSGNSRRAACWHPWRDMETSDRSGLLIVAGGLGSGKTFAAASLVYRTAMAGVPWHVFDPTGRLLALGELPEFAGRSRAVNLLQGQGGELNPYRVIADPVRDHFDTEEEWANAASEAQAQRSALCKDILRSFLPLSIRSGQRSASVLTRAVGRVPGESASSPRMVLDALLRIADGEIEEDLMQEHRITARDIWTELDALARTPNGKLIFDPGVGDLAPVGEDEPILTIYSLHGITRSAEQTVERGDESSEARMSMALLSLAAWLVQRSIYLTDPNKRKGLMIDEGHLLASLDAGRTLISKSATDSRKHNARVILSSQNVTHFDLDSIGNLVGAALIGRTEDEGAALAALKVLKLRPDPAHVKALEGLSGGSKRDLDERVRPRQKRRRYREFIFSDGRGVERIVVDMSAHPHVAAVLNSTPSQEESPAVRLTGHMVGAL